MPISSTNREVIIFHAKMCTSVAALDCNEYQIEEKKKHAPFKMQRNESCLGPGLGTEFINTSGVERGGGGGGGGVHQR